MKNLLKIAAVALMGVMSYNANAQLGINIKAGYNMNTVSASETKANNGFHVGATYEIPTGSLVNVEAGIFYDTRGSKVEIEMPFLGKISTKTNYNTITVPVLIKPRFEINDKVGAFVAVGPYMNYLINGKSGDIDIDFSKAGDNVNRTHFGIAFGGGVEFMSHYSIGIGYDLGLTKMNKYVDDSKLNAFKVTLGYRF